MGEEEIFSWWFTVNPIQVVVISAVANSLLYALLILLKKKNRQANRFLSLFMISLSLSFTPYLINGDVFNNYLWLSWMPFSLSYWIGPALFFYIRSLTQPKFRFKRKHLWHFAPIVLNYLHSIYHLIVQNGFPYPALHYTAEFLEFAAIFSILIYAYITCKELDRHRTYILQKLSLQEYLHLRWIKRLAKITIVIFLGIGLYLVLADEVLEKRFPDGQVLLYKNVLLVFYTFVMYFLTLGSFRQIQAIHNPIALVPLRIATPYRERQIELQRLMEDKKFYLDPHLSLKSLSVQSGFGTREISSILNKGLNQNFYDFVNAYRIAAVKRKLKDRSNDHLKIISLAYDAGFNSKASFHRIFKKHTGLSPSQYRNSFCAK